MPRSLPPAVGIPPPCSLGRLRTLLILIIVSVIVLTLVIVGRAISRDYTARQQSLRLDLTQRTLLLEQHTLQVLGEARGAIRTLEQDPSLHDCLSRADQACLQPQLAQLTSRFPILALLTLFDPEGRLVASSLAPLPDEADFPAAILVGALRQAAPQASYIGPLLTLPNQVPTLPLALYHHAEQPALRGIALLGLRADALSPVKPTPDGSMQNSLYLHDGTPLLHQPDPAQTPPPVLPQLLDNAEGFVDDPRLQRFIAWRAIDGWPLTAVIAEDRQEIAGAWREESLLQLLTAGLACLGALILLWHMLRLIRQQEKVEDALYLSRVAVEMGADMAIWLDHHARIRYVNTTACHRLGYSEQTLLGMSLADICPDTDMGRWPRFWRKLKQHKHLYNELTYKARTGETFPVEAHSSFVVFKGEEYDCAVVRDVTERKQAEADILRREQELRLALEASNTGLFDMPLEPRQPALTSPEYERLLGFEPGTLNETLESWKEQLHPADRELALEAYQDYYLGKSPSFIVEYRRRTREGHYRWFQTRGKFTGFDEQNRPTRLIGSMTDITERKQAEHRITELANLDAVTGLANRNLLRDELQAAVGSATRRKRRLAVLFLDLDRFKTINDSLGHAAGDAILAQVAGRLRQTVDKTDILARLGGDEFVVVLTDIGSPMEAGATAERLLAAFADPFRLEAGKFATTTSIGISVFPDDSRTPETLIRNADVAMYQAKAAGRNNYQFFTADMNTRAAERLTLETGLRQSLINHEFEILFQPQADLRSGHVIGAEALLRWRHPELGLIPPSKFIPVAEESRMIVEIGNWVLKEACRRAAGWLIAGLPPITVAVNLSPLQLHQANLLELVQQALIDSGLPPQYLELEVTETVVMQELEHVMSMLAGLKQLGVRLSLDDFGTGYSSLSYLKRFDFDKLKIDQTFVRDILSDANDAAIVRAIIGLGKTLGMSVLAEGVETFEQLDFLHRAGADAIQGYYFCPALTHEDFVEILRDRPMLSLPDGEIGM